MGGFVSMRGFTKTGMGGFVSMRGFTNTGGTFLGGKSQWPFCDILT